MEERKNDWKEVECALSDEELKEQTSRCMNCGQPFCHAYGCPLGNLVPDQNRAVAQGDFKRAYDLLSGRENERALNIRAFTESQKRVAYTNQKGVCPKCGKHFDFDEMEGDHIVPWSKGGKTMPENLQMLCRRCNGLKSAH